MPQEVPSPRRRQHAAAQSMRSSDLSAPLVDSCEVDVPVTTRPVAAATVAERQHVRRTSAPEEYQHAHSLSSELGLSPKALQSPRRRVQRSTAAVVLDSSDNVEEDDLSATVHVASCSSEDCADQQPVLTVAALAVSPKAGQHSSRAVRKGSTMTDDLPRRRSSVHMRCASASPPRSRTSPPRHSPGSSSWGGATAVTEQLYGNNDGIHTTEQQQQQLRLAARAVRGRLAEDALPHKRSARTFAALDDGYSSGADSCSDVSDSDAGVSTDVAPSAAAVLLRAKKKRASLRSRVARTLSPKGSRMSMVDTPRSRGAARGNLIEHAVAAIASASSSGSAPTDWLEDVRKPSSEPVATPCSTQQQQQQQQVASSSLSVTKECTAAVVIQAQARRMLCQRLYRRQLVAAMIIAAGVRQFLLSRRSSDSSDYSCSSSAAADSTDTASCCVVVRPEQLAVRPAVVVQQIQRQQSVGGVSNATTRFSLLRQHTEPALGATAQHSDADSSSDTAAVVQGIHRQLSAGCASDVKQRYSLVSAHTPPRSRWPTDGNGQSDAPDAAGSVRKLKSQWQSTLADADVAQSPPRIQRTYSAAKHGSAAAAAAAAAAVAVAAKIVSPTNCNAAVQSRYASNKSSFSFDQQQDSSGDSVYAVDRQCDAASSGSSSAVQDAAVHRYTTSTSGLQQQQQQQQHQQVASASDNTVEASSGRVQSRVAAVAAALAAQYSADSTTATAATPRSNSNSTKAWSPQQPSTAVRSVSKAAHDTELHTAAVTPAAAAASSDAVQKWLSDDDCSSDEHTATDAAAEYADNTAVVGSATTATATLTATGSSVCEPYTVSEVSHRTWSTSVPHQPDSDAPAAVVQDVHTAHSSTVAAATAVSSVCKYSYTAAAAPGAETTAGYARYSIDDDSDPFAPSNFTQCDSSSDADAAAQSSMYATAVPAVTEQQQPQLQQQQLQPTAHHAKTSSGSALARFLAEQEARKQQQQQQQSPVHAKAVSPTEAATAPAQQLEADVNAALVPSGRVAALTAALSSGGGAQLQQQPVQRLQQQYTQAVGQSDSNSGSLERSTVAATATVDSESAWQPDDAVEGAESMSNELTFSGLQTPTRRLLSRNLSIDCTSDISSTADTPAATPTDSVATDDTADAFTTVAAATAAAATAVTSKGNALARFLAQQERRAAPTAAAATPRKHLKAQSAAAAVSSGSSVQQQPGSLHTPPAAAVVAAAVPKQPVHARSRSNGDVPVPLTTATASVSSTTTAEQELAQLRRVSVAAQCSGIEQQVVTQLVKQAELTMFPASGSKERSKPAAASAITLSSSVSSSSSSSGSASGSRANSIIAAFERLAGESLSPEPATSSTTSTTGASTSAAAAGVSPTSVVARFRAQQEAARSQRLSPPTAATGHRRTRSALAERLQLPQQGECSVPPEGSCDGESQLLQLQQAQHALPAVSLVQQRINALTASQHAAAAVAAVPAVAAVVVPTAVAAVAEGSSSPVARSPQWQRPAASSTAQSPSASHHRRVHTANTARASPGVVAAMLHRRTVSAGESPLATVGSSVSYSVAGGSALARFVAATAASNSNNSSSSSASGSSVARSLSPKPWQQRAAVPGSLTTAAVPVRVQHATADHYAGTTAAAVADSDIVKRTSVDGEQHTHQPAVSYQVVSTAVAAQQTAGAPDSTYTSDANCSATVQRAEVVIAAAAAVQQRGLPKTVAAVNSAAAAQQAIAAGTVAQRLQSFQLAQQTQQLQQQQVVGESPSATSATGVSTYRLTRTHTADSAAADSNNSEDSSSSSSSCSSSGHSSSGSSGSAVYEGARLISEGQATSVRHSRVSISATPGVHHRGSSSISSNGGTTTRRSIIVKRSSTSPKHQQQQRSPSVTRHHDGGVSLSLEEADSAYEENAPYGSKHTAAAARQSTGEQVAAVLGGTITALQRFLRGESPTAANGRYSVTRTTTTHNSSSNSSKQKRTSTDSKQPAVASSSSGGNSGDSSDTWDALLASSSLHSGVGANGLSRPGSFRFSLGGNNTNNSTSNYNRSSIGSAQPSRRSSYKPQRRTILRVEGSGCDPAAPPLLAVALSIPRHFPVGGAVLYAVTITLRCITGTGNGTTAVQVTRPRRYSALWAFREALRRDGVTWLRSAFPPKNPRLHLFGWEKPAQELDMRRTELEYWLQELLQCAQRTLELREPLYKFLELGEYAPAGDAAAASAAAL
jgi:trimeric autotransporter adhesin